MNRDRSRQLAVVSGATAPLPAGPILMPDVLDPHVNEISQGPAASLD